MFRFFARRFDFEGLFRCHRWNHNSYGLGQGPGAAAQPSKSLSQLCFGIDSFYTPMHLNIVVTMTLAHFNNLLQGICEGWISNADLPLTDNATSKLLLVGLCSELEVLE